MTRANGWVPAAPDPRTLKVGDYLPDGLPAAPDTVDWHSLVTEWPLYQNDILEDCGPAAAAHMVQAWTTYAGSPVTLPASDVVGAFAAITGYDPSRPETNRGASELDVLKHWQGVGIGSHRIDSFAVVDRTNREEIRAALAIFGGLFAFVALPVSARGADLWDVPEAPSAPWGGHFVHLAGYDPEGVTCVTWGRTQRLTWPFLDRYFKGIVACISRDFLSASGFAPDGLDWTALAADLERIQSG